ncbi:MAG: N-acetyltransferase [Anaerolineales bacterium]|nr:N-acetyltransferase [Anaerolineales bacterium]
MKIRPETSHDINVIEHLTIAAFAGKPHSNQTEHLVINGLRDTGAVSVSLVAEMDNKVVGNIVFSLVTINGENINWYGLGPISVLPELQLQGIGSKLVKEGLSSIREIGAQGCVLEGSPEYYNRFGFKTYPGLFYEGAPAPEYFMALPFYDEVPQGKVEFHQAFYVSA